MKHRNLPFLIVSSKNLELTNSVLLPDKIILFLAIISGKTGDIR